MRAILAPMPLASHMPLNPCAVVVVLFLLPACGGAPRPAQPNGGPSEVTIEGAPPGDASTSGSSPAPPRPTGDARACCMPSGAYRPGDHAYQDCVAGGGRPWGTDGCGQNTNGTVVAPPPAMAPRP